MTDTAKSYWRPRKVLPWSSLSFGAMKAVGPAGSFGFTPVYDSEDIARREFPDDVIEEIRTIVTHAGETK